MKWKFKPWSQIKPEAKNRIDPKLGLRNWSSELISLEEKKRIWLYFNQENYFVFNKKDQYGRLANPSDFHAIISAVMYLNEEFKKQSLTENFLGSNDLEKSYEDFKNIFLNRKEDVVMEMLSIYAKTLFEKRQDKEIYQEENESQEEYDKRLLKWRLEPLEKFKKIFNDIFEQFELNYRLTKGGIIPWQPRKVIEEIYNPVLEFLSDKKFSEVNRDIEDAIKHFRKKTGADYSTCISNCITAIEAFLQILIYGEVTRKETLNSLFKKAQKRNLIPHDSFSKDIFINLEEILRKYRKKYSQAHSKEEYPNEKDAKLIMNLTMIFLQHCIEYD